VGLRIRQLREQAGLTLEKLAYESELGSKGYLSDIEKGLAKPTLTSLNALGERLGVALLDLVTFPDEDERQQLVDRSRFATPEMLARWLGETPPGPASRPASKKRR
jgi:transcriptional regulator with XRE-family HTH domain